MALFLFSYARAHVPPLPRRLQLRSRAAAHTRVHPATPRRYALRDIFFFGIAHHTKHVDVCAAAAVYGWRLRRGGIPWFSSRLHPLLPATPVNHPFGDHYGTLFLRVARIWDAVHRGTAFTYPWYVHVWDDNFVVPAGYVATANTASAGDIVALGRVGLYPTRKQRSRKFKFMDGGSAALMSNGLVRLQASVMPSCVTAVELWWANAPPTTPGFDDNMPECPRGRFGCDDVVLNYCLLRAVGKRYKQLAAPGFNHVNAEALNERGFFACRGLACRRLVRSRENPGRGQALVSLHWVRNGTAMVRYDRELYERLDDDPAYCNADQVNATCLSEWDE